MASPAVAAAPPSPPSLPLLLNWSPPGPEIREGDGPRDEAGQSAAPRSVPHGGSPADLTDDAAVFKAAAASSGDAVVKVRRRGRFYLTDRPEMPDYSVAPSSKRHSHAGGVDKHESGWTRSGLVFHRAAVWTSHRRTEPDRTEAPSGPLFWHRTGHEKARSGPKDRQTPPTARDCYVR